jgi:hypothetical protein
MFIDPILLLCSQGLDVRLLKNHFLKKLNDVVLDVIPSHPEVAPKPAINSYSSLKIN